MTSLAVIGDIHGNARALRAALGQVRRSPMDHLVFMGDLLTYGHDVHEVLDLVSEAQISENAVLLIGNHDQMYFDLAKGNTSYFDQLPEWIKQSVQLTVSRMDPIGPLEQLRWSEEWWFETLLFAHANPFGFGNFAYLNSEPDCIAALQSLQKRGATLGVFGHTHRAAWRASDITLANAGSVGQPRGAGSVLLRIELTADGAQGSFEPVQYDVNSHVNDIVHSGLPDATVRRLCQFFEPNP